MGFVLSNYNKYWARKSYTLCRTEECEGGWIRAEMEGGSGGGGQEPRWGVLFHTCLDHKYVCDQLLPERRTLGKARYNIIQANF